MSGATQGEIYTVSFIPIEISRLHEIGTRPSLAIIAESVEEYGLAFDSENNPSMPFWRPFNDSESIYTKITRCNGAEEKVTKLLFFKAKAEKICPAIGRFAVKPQDPYYEYITSGLYL